MAANSCRLPLLTGALSQVVQCGKLPIRERIVLSFMHFGSFSGPVRKVGVRPGGVAESNYLSVESLCVKYGSQVAVSGISFSAAKGELLTVLGPSGCGKTTILRSIAGFSTLANGIILVAGRDIAGLPPHRRNIGMVFQSYALFPHLTAFENAAFGLRMRHVRKPDRQKRGMAALALVGLADFSSRYPAQLSGGQQQRVALARAIAVEPDILLLDEPLSNLDVNLRAELRQEIRTLQKKLAITTLLVTHDQQEALAISDRIAILNQGRLVETGTPETLCENPNDAFAAGFIGARTVVSGVTRNGTFEAPGISFVGAPGGATSIILRAPRLRLGGEGSLRIKGRIASRVYLGDLFEVEVAAGGSRIKVVVPSEHPPPELGAECVISASSDAVSFLFG
jgi:putative spermidine/putrescine transport system ATP-binding protein